LALKEARCVGDSQFSLLKPHGTVRYFQRGTSVAWLFDMNAETAQKSGAARAAQPVEPEWIVEDQTSELEVEVDEDDDLYGNMPFTD